MPTVPRLTKCAQFGCKDKRSKLNQYCLAHGGKDSYTAPKSDKRREFNNMYATQAWSKIRMAQLSKTPVCQACLEQGRVTPANQVDHLFAWSALGKEAFFNNIFQSLCRQCHTHKGALEDKGIFRHYTEHGAKDYALGDYPRLTGSMIASGVA